jgi:hypothetical protein
MRYWLKMLGKIAFWNIMHFHNLHDCSLGRRDQELNYGFWDLMTDIGFFSLTRMKKIVFLVIGGNRMCCSQIIDLTAFIIMTWSHQCHISRLTIAEGLSGFWLTFRFSVNDSQRESAK